MKVFFRSGIVDSNLTLAEVVQIEPSKGYSDEIYTIYKNWYKITERIAEIDICELPGKYSFIDLSFKKCIGTLPGVHPIFEATEEKRSVFLDTFINLIKEKEQKKIIEKERRTREIKEEEERKSKCKIINIYEIQLHGGGEDGIDGYFDADILIVDKNVTIRVVARNVFDFGYYLYLKKNEGTDLVFQKENYTEDEKLAESWLYEFSPLHKHIRM